MSPEPNTADNTPDQAQAPADAPQKSHGGAFLGGAILGAVAGVGLGIAAWLVLFGTFGGLAGGAGIMTAMAVGAVGLGLYEGKSAVKRAKKKDEQALKPPSDNVEEKIVALEEGKGRRKPPQEFWRLGGDKEINDHTRHHHHWREREHEANTSFVDRLTASREENQDEHRRRDR